MDYHRQMLSERAGFYNIDAPDLEETLNKVNNLLKTTKLKSNKDDFRVLKALICVSMLSFLLAVFLGAFVHFGYAIGFTLLFFASLTYMFHRGSRQ